MMMTLATDDRCDGHRSSAARLLWLAFMTKQEAPDDKCQTAAER